MITLEGLPIKIAVLIPCLDEEITITKVVKDFKLALPSADIYVYDNNSTDSTFIKAKDAGAIVKKEMQQGKGNVIRSMFREVEADIYILVDGDDTYPANISNDLLQPIINKTADMVVGDRISRGDYDLTNDRNLHSFGNKFISSVINLFFKTKLRDIMSGYRVFSKKFVKTIPIHSHGFEVETEITLHCLDKNIKIQEIPIEYKSRPEGSYSKLNTYSDGFTILKTIMWLIKDFKPILFFSFISLLFFIATLIIGLPVINEFIELGYIQILPSAILATGLAMISVFTLLAGIILDSLSTNQRDQFQHYYTNYKG